jgi:hypothetical protein
MSEVSSITKTESGAYVWTETESAPDGPEVATYSTNEQGYGIWRNGKQIKGTSQFNLADCSASTRRRRVARFMES